MSEHKSWEEKTPEERADAASKLKRRDKENKRHKARRAAKRDAAAVNATAKKEAAA